MKEFNEIIANVSQGAGANYFKFWKQYQLYSSQQQLPTYKIFNFNNGYFEISTSCALGAKFHRTAI